LPATQVVSQGGRFIKSQLGLNQLPTFLHIVGNSSHLKVVYINRQGELKSFVHVNALPPFKRLEACFHERLSAMLLPEIAAEGVTIKRQAQRNNRSLETTFPCLGPLLRWELHPSIDFGHSAISVEFGLGISTHSVSL
jgi:hypothetical protein